MLIRTSHIFRSISENMVLIDVTKLVTVCNWPNLLTPSMYFVLILKISIFSIINFCPCGSVCIIQSFSPIVLHHWFCQVPKSRRKFNQQNATWDIIQTRLCAVQATMSMISWNIRYFKHLYKYKYICQCHVNVLFIFSVYY